MVTLVLAAKLAEVATLPRVGPTLSDSERLFFAPSMSHSGHVAVPNRRNGSDCIVRGVECSHCVVLCTHAAVLYTILENPKAKVLQLTS